MKYVVIIPLSGFRYCVVDAEDERAAIELAAHSQDVTEEVYGSVDKLTWSVASVRVPNDLIQEN